MPLGDVVVVKFPAQLLSLSDTNHFHMLLNSKNIFINYSDKKVQANNDAWLCVQVNFGCQFLVIYVIY